MAKKKDDIITRADGSVVKIGGYIAPDKKSSAGFYKATLKASKLPPKVDLRSMMTAVESQGEIGSCTANATAGAYEYLVRITQNADYDVSRLFMYYNARKSQGLEDEDSGALIEWLMEQMSTKGACSEATWPYNTKKFTKKPPKEAYEEAKNYKITKYEHVETNLNSWKSVLAEGYPIIFGVQIYESFENPRKGKITMPRSNEECLGGHAMCCVGYSDPDQVFIVRNSWGEQWGNGGYCYIPYDYMMDEDFNGGDSWVIYAAEPVDISQAEENWSDDDESLFVDMYSEFDEMDDDTWHAMCDELGDYDITYRLGALYGIATVGDDECSDEEYQAATDKLANILEMFGLNYDADEVMEYCAQLTNVDGFIEETVEILGRYLSPGALATIAKDMYEVAAIDGLDADEEQFIDNLVGDWFNEELAEEYDREYEEKGARNRNDNGGRGGKGKSGKKCKKRCDDDDELLVVVDDDDDDDLDLDDLDDDDDLELDDDDDDLDLDDEDDEEFDDEDDEELDEDDEDDEEFDEDDDEEEFDEEDDEEFEDEEDEEEFDEDDEDYDEGEDDEDYDEGGDDEEEDY